MAHDTSTPEPRDQQNWLAGLLGRLRGKRPPGDVIAANVGERASGVAVGKNIIQIGALVVPWWMLALLIAVVVCIAGATFFTLRGPRQMTGLFNVAVAEFGVEQADGSVGRSDAGGRMSRWLFDAVRQQQARYQAGGVGSTDSALVWHDSLPWTEQGTSIGVVTGSSAEEREAAAQQIAETIHAQVLIYGMLRRDNTVDLRFYVAPSVGIAGPSNALAGHYQVGDPLRFDPAAGDTQAGALTQRGSELFWLTTGLGYAGRGQYREALAVLRQAEEQLADVWDEQREGKEILYYFQGESALFLAWQSTVADDFERYAADAERAFRRSLASKRTYIRAQIGLGSLALYRSQCLLTHDPCPETATAAADSRRYALDSIAAYEQALQLAAQYPDQPWSEHVGPLALGIAYSVLGRIDFVERNDDAAIGNLTTGITQIGATLEPLRAAGEGRMLAQGYQAIGLAQRDLGDIASDRQDTAGALDHYTLAREAYAECIRIGGTRTFDTFVTDALVPLCQSDQATVEQRISSLAPSPSP